MPNPQRRKWWSVVPVNQWTPLPDKTLWTTGTMSKSLHLRCPGRSSTARPQEVAPPPSLRAWTQHWTLHLCRLQTPGWRVETAAAAVCLIVVPEERYVGEMGTGSSSSCRLRGGVWKAGANRWSRKPKTTSSQRRVRLRKALFCINSVTLKKCMSTAHARPIRLQTCVTGRC